MSTRALDSPHPATPHRVQPLPTRRFHGNRYVYTVLSQRAGGLSIGVNLNPDQRCNFDCIYCEIDRRQENKAPHGVQIPVLIDELKHMLEIVREGRIAELGYAGFPSELLGLKEIALSGDGEPTLCPNFREALEAILELREHLPPRFKIVVITNAIGLGFPKVRDGIAQLDDTDEIWAKLDAGTQAYMDLVNRPGISIELILKGIRDLARVRPVIIQSLFPLINGREPAESEIEAYANNLLELKEEGARITLVQIYSAHRPAMNARCGHLPLRSLSRIARRVRERTGLNAEVF